MKQIKKIIKSPLFWIFILALILRIYKLGEFPYGFHVDEAKVAWNALSILKTGRDDQGNFLSLYYNSFGDYRPSGIFYITVPSIAIFGRTEFATRFPTALFGALTVLPVYLLVELFNKNRKLKIKNINTGYLAAFLFATSPWHIELSRATNEVVISTFFALFSLYFFIKMIKDKKYKFGLLSIATIIFSYLFYHVIRFLAPPIFVITVVYYFKEIKKKEIKTWVWVCIGFTFLLTLLFSLTKEGLARLNQVSILNNVDTVYEIQRVKNEDSVRSLPALVFDNKYVIYIKDFVNEYGTYFSTDFLTGSAARPYRFTTPGTGLISYIEAGLLLLGIIETLKGKKNFLPLLLLLVAPLPAALTIEDAPNMSRAFFMLPFLILIEAYGLESILVFSKKYKKQIRIGIFSLLALNFIYFSYLYLNHSISHKPYLKDFFIDSPTYRDVGAKELAIKLDSLKSNYDKIIVTNFPDNLYPWYAFFNNKSPADFNKNYSNQTKERDYGNIIFSEEKCPTDNDLIKYSHQNILMIDSWECSFESQITDKSPLKIVGKIDRLDGSAVYTLLERDWSKPLIVNGVIIK